MSYFTKCISIVLLIFLFAPLANSQCPDDPDAMIVNTQEKYDYMTKNFPNCNSYEFYMVNGKFLGEPRPMNYLMSLLLLLGVILITIKLVVIKFNLE